MNFKGSLQNEIAILRKINQKNLIQLDSVHESSNSYYLIFELFMGGNLTEYVKNQGLFTEIHAAFVIRKILEGVKYLHNLNIMHRDIKPDNILFRSKDIYEKDQIVLADFGLATSNDVIEYLHPKCGTPGFAAPEVFNVKNASDHYSLKCDLFSVGVTLYFMLTGNLPYCYQHDLLKENKDCLFNFNISKKFAKLSDQGFFILRNIEKKKKKKLAQDFLLHLICKENARLDINQALNHEFLTGKSLNMDIENLMDAEESARAHISSLEHNIKDFNKYLNFNKKRIFFKKSRKLNLFDKNLMGMSPGHSPVLSPYKNEQKSMSFVSLTPIFNGFIRTLRSITSLFNNKEDSFAVEYEMEEDNIILRNGVSNATIQPRISNEFTKHL